MRPTPSRPPRHPRRFPAALAPALFATLAAGGCASGGRRELPRDPATDAQITTRVAGGSGAAVELRTVNTPGASGVESAAPAGAERVFAVLPAAYDAVQLPINTVLADARTLGLRDARAPRRVAGQPLSRFLDCGAEATGAQHADAWAVTLTVLTRVAPAGDAASTVSTQVVASARPVTTSGAAVTCTTNGRLEQAINTALLTRLGR